MQWAFQSLHKSVLQNSGPPLLCLSPLVCLSACSKVGPLHGINQKGWGVQIRGMGTPS